MVRKPKQKSGQEARCQNCLKRGHWTYECKGEPKYLERSSRTKQLKAKQSRLAELRNRQAASVVISGTDTAGSKKRRRKSSSSSSSSDSSSSDGSTGSSDESSSGGSSTSDSDSDSSGSSSGSSSTDSSDSSDSDSSSSSSESDVPRRKRRRRWTFACWYQECYCWMGCFAGVLAQWGQYNERSHIAIGHGAVVIMLNVAV